MNRKDIACWTMVALAASFAPWRAADAAVTVVFGTSWDAQPLQSIVDQRYGPGRIHVTTDYIGARAGDPDPWFWVDRQFSALLIREVAGNANTNILGWYSEEAPGVTPVIDDVNDGVVFDGLAGTNSAVLMFFDGPTRRFGFYLNPNGAGSVQNAPEPEKFFTNRRLNDIGPDGSAARHAPTDGDVQALVFDVSPWTFPNTWLVCFEDLDSGADVTSCCTGTDNDFNDLVFEVTAFGVTPIEPLTFGAIKSRYR
jgi:hypothetical protein